MNLSNLTCKLRLVLVGGLLGLAALATPVVGAESDAPAAAAEAPVPISAGDTAWMLTSTALVLFMTLPGLALFYGGLVRKKNVLSVLAQCLGIAGL
ncbi:ammonia permease, partial [Opitutaceae bacterium TAV1]